jgi:hypothetical protein
MENAPLDLLERPPRSWRFGLNESEGQITSAHRSNGRKKRVGCTIKILKHSGRNI